MSSKVNRLQKKKDIERVFKKGKSFKEDFLVLKTARNNLRENRFGFVISQKISKKAVIRNMLRRRLRELIRAELRKKNSEEIEKPQSSHNLKFGADNLLIAVPGLERKDFWEIQETVNRLFKKAKII